MVPLVTVGPIAWLVAGPPKGGRDRGHRAVTDPSVQVEPDGKFAAPYRRAGH